MHLRTALIAAIALTIESAHAETERLINTRDSYPSASPDNQQLVFQSNRTEINQVFLMNMDGSNIRQLTDMPGGTETPVFSPDGQKVLYRKVTNSPAFNWSLQHSERNSEIFVSDPDGKNEINISNNAAFDGWPAWSPDGKSIYAYRLKETEDYEFGTVVRISIQD